MTKHGIIEFSALMMRKTFSIAAGRQFPLGFFDILMPGGIDGLETIKRILDIDFAISDTGIGIPADKAESIFDSFQQADGSTSKQFGGTGLGLSISQQLVQFMGGKIRVKSEVGKGSVFDFSLPLQVDKSSHQLQENPEPNISLKRKGAALLQPLRILLAEDELINRELAVILLEMEGWHITVVENGKEALEAFSSSTFDLILMDIQMPIMDGLTATSQIRQKEKKKKDGSHIPIIAMTAHALKSFKQKSLEVGVDAFITKPINRYQLINCINEYTTLDITDPRSTS